MNRSRATLVVLLVVPAAFAWACGGSDNTLDDGGGVDSSNGNDGTVNNDSGPGKDGSSNDTGTNDTGTNDTGTNDTGTNDTGTNDTGTTDGGLPPAFQCQKPSDCDAGEFCCGTIIFNGGTLPNCTLEDASSACTSTCKSNVQLSCKATDTVRTCVAHVDCADAGTGYTDCCTVPFGDASAEFCWTKNYQQFITGMTCL
jgi:hypothetical protein